MGIKTAVPMAGPHLEELAGDVQEQQDKRQLGKLKHDVLMDAIDDATGQSRR